ncbi:MAG: MBL fold metallo-hydrolase [Pseudobdellovibrio sp.]
MKSNIKLFKFIFIALSGLLYSCSQSTHPFQKHQIGANISSAQMEAILDTPGPIEVQSITSAEWTADLAGLVNLDSTKAKTIGLKNESTSIQIFSHKFKHPSKGSFLIDTGVSEKVLTNPYAAGVNWLLQKVMHFDRIKIIQSTEHFISTGDKISAVFLTHMHVDHITGMPAVPNDIPIYAGPNETSFKRFLNLFSQSTTDNLLNGKAAILELEFIKDSSQNFAGIIDLFNDGTAFAIHTPGHTDGSISYLLRTRNGPILFTGDTCHTRWGWNNSVEPGFFTDDQVTNLKSLLALRALALRHPTLQIRLGHQL